MTPGARFSAILDLLECAFIPEKQPFDLLITQFFKQRRYAGSKDRRFILDNTYGVLRNFYKLLHLAQVDTVSLTSLRLYLLGYLKFISNHEIEDLEKWFSGDGHAPALLTQDERAFLINLPDKSLFPEWAEANVPEFLWPELQSIFGRNTFFELDCLNQEATVDLRVNLLKTNRASLKQSLENEGIESQETDYSPYGLRLKSRINLKNSPLYQQGLFEFQDEASQLVSLLCDVDKTETVLDYCAGAGGKSLALSMFMEGQGTLEAYDIFPDRLKKTGMRAQRAAAHNIHLLKHEPTKVYSRVLVDAPCSGIGTWRRHPEWRLTLTPQKLKDLTNLQKEILIKGSKNVDKGGRLIYVTCSVLASENEYIISDFLSHHSEFKIIPVSEIWKKYLTIPCQEKAPFLRFTPYQHKMDGFFIAIFENTWK